MTTTFYCPPSNIDGPRIALPSDEARHAVQVLRHRAGDDIEVVDGEGGWYRLRLEVAVGDSVSGRVEERRSEVGEPPYALVLGFGVIKNTSRLETLVEKAVELGVRRLVPLETERTERTRLRADRLERIVVAAMKQCGRSRRTQIDPLTALPTFLASSADGVRMICHEATGPEQAMLGRLNDHPSGSYTIAVGPEGGFSGEELGLAQSHGFLPVHLGARRLRAETAAITAAALLMAYVEPERSAGAASDGA